MSARRTLQKRKSMRADDLHDGDQLPSLRAQRTQRVRDVLRSGCVSIRLTSYSHLCIAATSCCPGSLASASSSPLVDQQRNSPPSSRSWPDREVTARRRSRGRLSSICRYRQRRPQHLRRFDDPGEYLRLRVLYKSRKGSPCSLRPCITLLEDGPGVLERPEERPASTPSLRLDPRTLSLESCSESACSLVRDADVANDGVRIDRPAQVGAHRRLTLSRAAPASSASVLPRSPSTNNRGPRRGSDPRSPAGQKTCRLADPVPPLIGFVRRKDAERFIEEVRGDDPAVAAKWRSRSGSSS